MNLLLPLKNHQIFYQYEALSEYDSRGNSTHQTYWDIDNLFKIFKFAADNTNVEWSLHRGQDDKYVIGTSHQQNSVMPYDELIGEKSGSLPITSVHSHPNIVGYENEIYSMGYRGGSYDNDKNKVRNGQSPKYNYVYFPHSKRLYNVEYYTPRYIRQINTFRDFYFGTLNYK